MPVHRVYTLALTILALASSVAAQPAPPVVGRNVNMVSGISLADGDPFLQRQNEVSAAVSSVNPLHIFAGANDYRLIDLDGSFKDIPGDENAIAAADSWVGLYKSTDGGRTWRTNMLSGCPLNITQCNDPKSSALKGLIHAADPTMRSGPYGSFFLSFLANNRGTGADGVVAVQRFFDLNNNIKAADDPYAADKLNIIETGTSGQLKDKPWVIADVPGRSFNNGTCSLPTSPTPVKAFNIYVSYSNFVGQSADNPHPQIFVARSTDCGLTFEKGKKVSPSVNTSQGTFLTIDPTNGAVYLFWRQIATAANADPNAIVFVKSTDGGNTWSSPAILATINPFDQETSGGRFRTKAYPTAAVSVDSSGVSRVHVVWSERGVGPGGSARIVMSTSSNGGNTWSAPAPVDNSFAGQTVPYAGGVAWAAFNPGNPLGLGHQFQPSIVFAGGLLTVLWADQRNDSTEGTLVCPSSGNYSIKDCREVRVPVGNLAASPGSSTVFSANIDDATPGLLRRHSIEIFTAQAAPSASPLFSSTRVSQYLYGSRGETLGVSRSKKTIKQLQYNAPNLPLFQQGQSPFLGDYKDITAQTIIPTGNSANPYIWNTSAANGANTVFHGVWTDNRDVIRPSDGNWRNYTPIKLLNSAGTGLSANASCVTGQAGMRNQNVYAATIGGGIDAHAIVNSKRLPSTGAPRQFNIVLQNGTSLTRTFNLVISPPAGGVTATFKPGASLTVVSVNVLPNSSAVRTVWVASATNPGATVAVNVSSGSTLINVLLNPDSGSTSLNGNPAPDVTNIVQGNVTVINNDLTNNDLTNNDLTNNDLTNNDLTNNDLTNNDLTNNDLTNNDLTNNDLTNNDLTNNDLTNNDLTNNDLTNNDLTNNDLTNNDLTNGAVTDTSFMLFNKGTTDVALNLKTILRGNSIPPNSKLQLIVHKTYATQLPKLANLGGACGDTYSKSLQNAVLLNVPSPTVTSATDPTLAEFKAEDSSTGNASISLLPQESAYVTYRLVYNQTGQNIPQNQAPAFEFGSNGVKVVPVNASSNIIPIPLIISTLSLPSALAGAVYDVDLTAQGGLGARTWSMLNGSLPPGVTLTPAGKLSGTPATPGQYTFTVRVTDQSTPSIQTDKQTLTLTVQGAQTQSIPSGSLMYGSSITLPSSTSAGLPITYALVSGGCTISGNLVTAISGTGVCSVNASNPGTVIYLPFNQPTSFALALSPLTVKANDASVTYGFAALPAFTASLSGLVGGDLPGSVGTVSFTSTATSASLPGPYPITPSGLTSTNYLITYVNGTLTVGQATLTVKANNASRIYGDANPPFTATYSGFAGTDTFGNSVTGDAGLTTTAVATTPVGTATITAAAGTLASVKYKFAFVNGTLNITKAPLTVTATSFTRAYGELNPAFTVNFSGFKNNETLGTSGVAGAPVLTTTAQASSLVASAPYAIVVSPGTLAAANYSFLFVNGGLTIIKATPVFSNLAPAVVFQGAASSPFSGTLSYVPVGSPAVFPTGAVSVTLNGVTQPAAIGSAGAFSSAGFNTSSLVPGSSYTASFTYAGDANFNAATAGSLTVTVAGFQSTGSMAVARSFHTATLLNGGKVLVAGGFAANGQSLASAEVYDPSSGKFTPTANNMPNKAAGHTATLMGNGKVLLVGGGNSSAQVYDPATNSWSSTGGSGQRTYHTAVLLPSGRVLIAGGSDNAGKTINTAQLYDPATGTFSATGNMAVARDWHTASLLPDGRVLIAGGRTSSGNRYDYAASSEIYDPATGRFTATGAMTEARFAHTAVLLNGKVLVSGGANSNTTTAIATANIYDPAIGTWSAAGPMETPRRAFTSTVIGTSVLSVGGFSGSTRHASTEIFNGTAYIWGPMSAPRSGHTATSLNDGRVLIVGGQGTSGAAVNTAEVYGQ